MRCSTRAIKPSSRFRSALDASSNTPRKYWTPTSAHWSSLPSVCALLEYRAGQRRGQPSTSTGILGFSRDEMRPSTSSGLSRNVIPSTRCNEPKNSMAVRNGLCMMYKRPWIACTESRAANSLVLVTSAGISRIYRSPEMTLHLCLVYKDSDTTSRIGNAPHSTPHSGQNDVHMSPTS